MYLVHHHNDYNLAFHRDKMWQTQASQWKSEMMLIETSTRPCYVGAGICYIFCLLPGNKTTSGDATLLQRKAYIKIKMRQLCALLVSWAPKPRHLFRSCLSYNIRRSTRAAYVITVCWKWEKWGRNSKLSRLLWGCIHERYYTHVQTSGLSFRHWELTSVCSFILT